MSRTKDSIAGLLIGFGLVLGFIPIAIASLLINKNLFIEIISRMDLFWKEREQITLDSMPIKEN